jgi:beta-mannosidase
VSYHLLDENGIEISGGSVIFSLPKYFKYEDPKLELEASADTITITSSAYARGVEILNDNEDIILSDNYFDMDKGTKTIKVISGSCDNLRLRSVYDIK